MGGGVAANSHSFQTSAVRVGLLLAGKLSDVGYICKIYSTAIKMLQLLISAL
jgi:hypothetical protein